MDIYQLYPHHLKEITLTLPCSKSIVNRLIPLSVHFDVPLQIDKVTVSTDIETSLNSIAALGVSVSYAADAGIVRLEKKQSKKIEKAQLYAGPSGTTLRFMTALAPFLAYETYIDGDNSLKQRPVQDLLEVLQHQLGVEINYHEKHGYLPFTLISTTDFPKTQHLTVKADKSSQFASALLMILPYLGPGASLTLVPPVHSYSYIELTFDIMRQLGFDIQKTQEFTYTYQNRRIPSQEIIFIPEADWSAATFWYGYTALARKKCTLIGLKPDSAQGERNIQQIMQRIGIHSEFNTQNELEIFPAQSPLQPIHADLTLLPDAAPMLAVLAAFIQGKSVLTGLQTLIYKETDRIRALSKELRKMQVHTEYTSDTLIIHGTQPKSAVIETYHDHRIAMAFAMAGIQIPYLSILDPDCVKKSYPHFWQEYKKTGMLILPRKTVL